MLVVLAMTALYLVRVTTANLMGVTVTNYGFIGNRFVSRSPSMEYPIGTGFEHLVYGGLWIGGRSSDESGPFTGVTTACLDIPQGASSVPATEFSPAGDQFVIRSSLVSSPHYDPAAVSELDLISDYDDLTPKTASGNSEAHRPLGLKVRQGNYAWSTGRLAHVLFFRFVVTSAGPSISDLRVGINTELGSGQKNDYATWPPSSASGPGSWFSKAWLQYDDPLRLLREHYCAALPVPSGCNLGYVPYWVGVKLLTAPLLGQQRTLAAWQWSPGAPSRDEDIERYALMSLGTVADLTQPELMPQTGDPIELLAIGPFPTLAPGDSAVVGFALIGGTDVADIQENAAAAQTAWDAYFPAPPSPVAVPFDAPGRPLAIEGWSLTSASARPRVALTLASGSPATLELFDPAGRQLHAQRIDGLGAGPHTVALDAPGPLASGVYFLRLGQGGRFATRRVVALR